MNFYCHDCKVVFEHPMFDPILHGTTYGHIVTMNNLTKRLSPKAFKMMLEFQKEILKNTHTAQRDITSPHETKAAVDLAEYIWSLEDKLQNATELIQDKSR